MTTEASHEDSPLRVSTRSPSGQMEMSKFMPKKSISEENEENEEEVYEDEEEGKEEEEEEDEEAEENEFMVDDEADSGDDALVGNN